MNFESIGKNIRKYRIAKKIRQEDLAEMCGLSATYIGMVERGEKVPSLETFLTILNALDVSADMVLSEVLSSGYEVRNSMLDEKLSQLSTEKRSLIYDVIDTIIVHSIGS